MKLTQQHGFHKFKKKLTLGDVELLSLYQCGSGQCRVVIAVNVAVVMLVENEVEPLFRAGLLNLGKDCDVHLIGVSGSPLRPSI